eukprot:7253021-Prymnesium_polylepis.1
MGLVAWLVAARAWARRWFRPRSRRRLLEALAHLAGVRGEEQGVVVSPWSSNQRGACGNGRPRWCGCEARQSRSRARLPRVKAVCAEPRECAQHRGGRGPCGCGLPRARAAHTSQASHMVLRISRIYRGVCALRRRARGTRTTLTVGDR